MWEAANDELIMTHRVTMKDEKAVKSCEAIIIEEATNFVERFYCHTP
jgi:hypothetical protein